MGVAGRRQREREVRKHSILEAAASVFEEHGYDEAAMEAIAERANVNIATVYYYYASKEALYIAVLARGMEQAVDELRSAIAETDDTTARLRNAAHAYARFQQRHPDLLLLLEHVRREHEPDEAVTSAPVVNDAIAIAGRARNLVADVLVRGGERGELRRCAPQETAWLLWAGLTGVLLAAENTDRARTTAVERWLDLVVDGLRPG